MKYPEMVKTNARYRGPRESGKQSGSMKDINSNVKALESEYKARKNEAALLMSDMVLFHEKTLPTSYKSVYHTAKGLRGGEM